MLAQDGGLRTKQARIRRPMVGFEAGVDDFAEQDRLLERMRTAALGAGALALEFFRSGERTRAAIEYKSGGSPVTEADFAVDRFLERELWPSAPASGWLSEEKADDLQRLDRRRVFIVDPIDGTRAFVRGDPRWAVSIALVVDGAPAVAVLHLPALDRTYAAIRGGGATLNGRRISVSSHPSLDQARAAGPAFLLQALQRAGAAISPQAKVPSLALRIAQVASAEFDLGLASTDAHDWDIAAADLILHEAGGVLCDVSGEAPRYNAREPRHGVLVAVPRQLKRETIAAMRTLELGSASTKPAPHS